MVPFQALEEAAIVIQQGGVVAFPTETYYGLGVDPFNEAALDKLYKLKRRPSHKPLLTLISHLDQLLSLAEIIPPCFIPLVDLWPAPITLVFPARKDLSHRLTAGTHTVGVRMSPHAVAQHLVKQCGHPITATSANRSGAPAACSAKEVQEQFSTDLDYIVDGGITPGGLGSTLVGCHNDKPVLLREGVLDPATLPCSF